MAFDDSMPAARDYDDDEFYAEFGTCFARNAGFSEKKPVPPLGNATTPIQKVIKFYEFWLAFKSWRDFTVEDEYDLEQAENRYERRYMERENKRMKQGELKAEKIRIRKLVDLARARDPRIIKHEKEESERVEKIREEKRLEKQKKKDDEEKRKADDVERARAKIQQEKDDIKRKEEEAKAIKMIKKNKLDEFKSLVDKNVSMPEYGPFFLDYFYDSLIEDEFTSIIEVLKSGEPQESMRLKWKEFVARVKERQSPQHSKKTDTPKQSKLVDTSKWTDEEMQLLTKGILKFPAGLGSRWDKIAEYIGGSKNIHEVTAMAKELSVKNVRGEKNIIETIKAKTEASNSVITPKAVDTKTAVEAKPAGDKPLEWSQS